MATLIASLLVLPHGAAKGGVHLLVHVVLIVDVVGVLVEPNDARDALTERDREVDGYFGIVVPVHVRVHRALRVGVNIHGERRRVVIAAPELNVVILPGDLLQRAIEVRRRGGVLVLLPRIGGVVGCLLEVGVDECRDARDVGAGGGVDAVIRGLLVYRVHDLIVVVVVDAPLGVDGVVGPQLYGVVGAGGGDPPGAEEGQDREDDPSCRCCFS